jgi:hypothetical protein
VLLALCGVLDAVISVIYVVMRETDGPLTLQSWNGTIMFAGKLALASGACTIAAGIWRSATGKGWLLVLNGLALGALGLIQYGLTRFRISFLTIALLIVVMAMSIGIVELVVAQTLRHQRHIADAWFLALAGVASFGFAVAFLGLGLRWIKIEPGSHADLLWLGSYFGFSAICMLWLALRLHSAGSFPIRPVGSLTSVGKSKTRTLSPMLFTLVGQTIALCGLPSLGSAWQATQNDRLLHRNIIK